MSQDSQTHDPKERAPSISPRTSLPGHAERTPVFHDRRPSQAHSASTDEVNRPTSSRSLGIHGLINPSNPPSTGGRPLDAHISPHASTPGYQTDPAGTPQPYVFTGHPGASHPPHQSATTPFVQTPTEKGSPAAAYPFPAINNPRHTASPLPRPDLTRGVGERYRGSSITPLPSPGSVPELASRSETRGFETPLSEHGVQGHHALAFAGHRHSDRPPGSLANTPRAASQPLIPYPRYGGHVQQAGPAGPADTSSIPWAQVPPAGASTHAPGSAPVSPSTTIAKPSEDNVGTPLYRSLLSAAASGSLEGHTMLRMASGMGGEPLEVILDTNNASRQMDEKRQRNAYASSRHRRRKKEEVQFLEGELRDVKLRLQMVEQERDFYRADRARLREIVLRTPLAEQAAGPPSPTGSPAVALESSSSDAGPLPAKGLRREPTESISDRPTRRRRTKGPAEQAVQAAYASPSPMVTLPPLSGASYSSAVEQSPSMPPGARLPSLRAVEGQLGALRQDPVPAAPLGVHGYPAYTRVPHETGWVHQLSDQQGNYSQQHPGAPHPMAPYDQPRRSGSR